jgi:hypothetical protein
MSAEGRSSRLPSMSSPWLRTSRGWARAVWKRSRRWGASSNRLGGLPRERLLVCDAEGRDGTRLGGCVKTNVPWPAGRFGAVMIPVSHPARSGSE